MSPIKRDGGKKSVIKPPTERPPLKRISDVVWEISSSYKKDNPKMQVPARIYGTKKLIDEMDLAVFEQVSNVACLPGIVKAAMCMPDGHWGFRQARL